MLLAWGTTRGKTIYFTIESDYIPFLSKENQLIDAPLGRFLVLLKNLYILSLSTHGLFFTDQGPGLQAGATGRVYRRGQVPLKVQKHLKSNKSLPKGKKDLTKIYNMV